MIKYETQKRKKIPRREGNNWIQRHVGTKNRTFLWTPTLIKKYKKLNLPEFRKY